MKLQVFNFEGWDQMSGSMIVPARRSTRERIERTGCKVIEASMAEVDERLVDDEGQVRFDFNELEGAHLRELRDKGGRVAAKGNWPHRNADRLVEWGLVKRRTTALGQNEYELTELGKEAANLV
jgi:hypothetical protein